MMTNLSLVLDHVLKDYALAVNGLHGVVHWARVLENSLKLAESTGANSEVVRLFAVLHDCRRLNDNHDPAHGPRAAALALTLQGEFFNLSQTELKQLHRACEGHTHERFHADPTIQTCWDSDRLDLGRVGIQPHPKYLGTDLAKTPEMINWAYGRSIMEFVPEFVTSEWGIVIQAHLDCHQ